MIQDRTQIKVGTILVGRYHKQEHTCEVVELAQRQAFRIDRKPLGVYKSLSAAGKAITGHECDGWHFWTIAGQEVITRHEDFGGKECEVTETVKVKDEKEKTKAGVPDDCAKCALNNKCGALKRGNAECLSVLKNGGY